MISTGARETRAAESRRSGPSKRPTARVASGVAGGDTGAAERRGAASVPRKTEQLLGRSPPARHAPQHGNDTVEQLLGGRGARGGDVAHVTATRRAARASFAEPAALK